MGRNQVGWRRNSSRRYGRNLCRCEIHQVSGRELDLEVAARTLLDAGSPDVWDQLSRLFEGQLIRTALALTRGRRIEAAQKLGIGRNTITRKIQELGLED